MLFEVGPSRSPKCAKTAAPSGSPISEIAKVRLRRYSLTLLYGSLNLNYNVIPFGPVGDTAILGFPKNVRIVRLR
jgi:hypothetical protein